MYNNQGHPGGEQPQQPNYGPYSQGYPPPQGSYPPPQGSNPPPYSSYPPQQGYPYQPGAQPQGQPYNPVVPPMPIATPPPQRKRGGASGCLSSLGGLLVFALIIVGLTSIPLFTSEKAGAKPLDPQASSYFKVVEMGKGKLVPLPDEPLYEPQTTFKRFDRVAVGFDLDFDKIDFKKQSAYYTSTEYFHKHWLLDIYTLDEESDDDNKILKIENDGLNLGVHSISGLNDTGKWKAELYWCEKSDCSDAKLARSLDFVVA